MGGRYVEVSRQALVGTLEAAGFEAVSAGGELVYRRRHHLDTTMFVKVYTSLPARAGDARGCGEDAIRVLLVFENPRTGASGCLHKASRVYRTGSESAVVERMMGRARECYAEANRRYKERQQAAKKGASR